MPYPVPPGSASEHSDGAGSWLSGEFSVEDETATAASDSELLAASVAVVAIILCCCAIANGVCCDSGVMATRQTGRSRLKPHLLHDTEDSATANTETTHRPVTFESDARP